MGQVKASELREKSLDELKAQEETLREQVFKLRFQKATGQSENPQRIGLVRSSCLTLLMLRNISW